VRRADSNCTKNLQGTPVAWKRRLCGRRGDWIKENGASIKYPHLAGLQGRDDKVYI
jgi:hypothetical protein